MGIFSKKEKWGNINIYSDLKKSDISKNFAEKIFIIFNLFIFVNSIKKY